MTPRGVRLVTMAIEEFFSLEEITLKHCGSPADAKVELFHTHCLGMRRTPAVHFAATQASRLMKQRQKVQTYNLLYLLYH